jgi:hypothetical protein
MIPHLTYRPRDGIIFGVVAGRSFRLTTQRNQAGMALEAWRQVARSGGRAAPHVVPWDHTYEFRVGRWAHAEGPGQRLTAADSAPLEIFDYPGAYAGRFDGVDKGGGTSGSANHRHHARVVWVKFGLRQGFPIHGLPACGDSRCIVIVQEWDSLFNALKATRQVSIVVEL